MLRNPALENQMSDTTVMQAIEAGLRRFVHEFMPMHVEQVGDVGMTLIASATCFDDSDDAIDAPPAPTVPAAA